MSVFRHGSNVECYEPIEKYRIFMTTILLHLQNTWLTVWLGKDVTKQIVKHIEFDSSFIHRAGVKSLTSTIRLLSDLLNLSLTFDFIDSSWIVEETLDIWEEEVPLLVTRPLSVAASLVEQVLSFGNCIVSWIATDDFGSWFVEWSC